VYLHAADVTGKRSRMIVEKQYAEGLVEIWRIKREISSEYSNAVNILRG
jgi:hypothetical protein